MIKHDYTEYHFTTDTLSIKARKSRGDAAVQCTITEIDKDRVLRRVRFKFNELHSVTEAGIQRALEKHLDRMPLDPATVVFLEEATS